MSRAYQKIPIVDTARRCGLVLDSRTLGRREVEASCPFCGDRGPGKHHLYLRTDTDQYHCVLCGAKGNSVTLYARTHNLSNKEAFLELTAGGKVYPFPQQPTPQIQEKQPRPLSERHEVYTDMLSLLSLSDAHRTNLLERGLSDERIERNMYRTMPKTEQARRLLASLLRRCGHDLDGIPGFRTYYGDWTISGPDGFLIPVRNKEGLIQGLKIRKDNEDSHISRLPQGGERNGDQSIYHGGSRGKYRWFSSRDMTHGTRSYSWIHVTGNIHSTRAFLTEGPLKGDVASFLSDDSLFVCLGGVGAIGNLSEVLTDLGVTEVVEAMDMDMMTNPQVRQSVFNVRAVVQKLPGIKYRKYTWNPVYKGIDDYYKSLAATM